MSFFAKKQPKNAKNDKTSVSSQSYEKRGRRLTELSYDIRTEINNIIGLSAIAMQDEGISEEFKGNLEKNAQAARRLLICFQEALGADEDMPMPDASSLAEINALHDGKDSDMEGTDTDAGGKKTDISFEGKRILIAEDMMVNAEILKQLLSLKGAEVFHASDGSEAVELYTGNEEGFFDAVLMDLIMPGVDGFEAARRIRSAGREDSGRLPIIALTASTFEQDSERSMEAGMNAHLIKPVEPDRLYEVINGFLK